MLPVLWIFGIAGRKPEGVAVGGHSEAKHGAIGVGKVTRHLVDLEDLAIVQARCSKLDQIG